MILPVKYILSPTFIAGITNGHLRHKLRWGSSGKTLKEVYVGALYQDQLQTLRSVDFPETAPVSHVDINATGRDTCKKCLKADHWARNCTATVKGNDHVFDTQHGQSSDSQLSADIRALIKTLSDIYSQGRFFPNMSHTQNAHNTPNTPSHKRHGQFPQNNHRNNHENTNRGSNAFSNSRTSLTYNRPNPCNRTVGHRNFRSSNHTMVHEMSQGEEPLEECDCNECTETPEEEGPLGSPESPSSEDPKKLHCSPQPHPALSVELGGPSHIPISSQNDFANDFVNIAIDSSPSDNPQIRSTTLGTTPETTDVVHISRKKNECSFLLKTGERNSRPYEIVVLQGVFFLITFTKAYQISLKQNYSQVQSR